MLCAVQELESAVAQPFPPSVFFTFGPEGEIDLERRRQGHIGSDAALNPPPITIRSKILNCCAHARCIRGSTQTQRVLGSMWLGVAHLRCETKSPTMTIKKGRAAFIVSPSRLPMKADAQAARGGTAKLREAPSRAKASTDAPCWPCPDGSKATVRRMPWRWSVH